MPVPASMRLETVVLLVPVVAILPLDFRLVLDAERPRPLVARLRVVLALDLPRDVVVLPRVVVDLRLREVAVALRPLAGRRPFAAAPFWRIRMTTFLPRRARVS